MHLHGAGGLRLTPAHDLLARRFRVVAFEMPGFGQSPENTQTRSMAGARIDHDARRLRTVGLDTFNLMGTSFGGKHAALWLAAAGAGARARPWCSKRPRRSGRRARSRRPGSPEEMARRLYAHPERLTGLPAVDPAVRAKTQALVQRLRGPDRDA